MVAQLPDNPQRKKTMKVLVTGATGRVGGEVVKALLQRGVDVRASTPRQPKPGTFPDAVEIALGDLTDPVSIGEALKNVDKVFLLIAGVADGLIQALIAYGLSKKAGLKHVTYLSVFKADQFREVPHFAAMYAIEEAIRAGRMPYTILRPAYSSIRHVKTRGPNHTVPNGTGRFFYPSQAVNCQATIDQSLRDKRP
jgi:uncharacterized protein YbjT (DUF2867 family)